MPGYRGHISTAILSGSLLLVGLGQTAAAQSMPLPEKLIKATAMLLFAVLFALFPDVDIKSRGQHLFYRLFFLLDAALLIAQQYQLAAYLGLLALVPILSRHRGWTHSVWAMLLVPLPILLVPHFLADAHAGDVVPLYLGAVTGYFSHLMADGMIFRRRKLR